MNTLNEYLQSLISSKSNELHLIPNKPPFLVTANGVSEISGAMMLGTQISQIVFPIIPVEARNELPNKPQVEFVLPHKLGNFNFSVKKSPAGFNVIVKPIMQEVESETETSEAPARAPQMPTLNAASIVPVINPNAQIQHELSLPTPFEEDIHITQAPLFGSAPPFENSSPLNHEIPSPLAHEIFQPQTFEFESASSAASVEIQTSDQIADLITEPQEDSSWSIPYPKVETAPVHDPEFITTFSESSNYFEPGSKYDYGLEIVPENENIPETPALEQKVETGLSRSPVISPVLNETVTPDVPQNQVQQSIPPPARVADETKHSVFSPAQVDVLARKAMDDMFYKMAAEKASDLHLSVSVPPMIRKDGKMKFLQCNEEFLSPDRMKQLLTSIMPVKNQEEFDTRHDTDFAYEIPDLARFRANIFMDRKGMGGVFRIIPSQILTAEQLGLSKAIMDLCNLSKGLVVVTGPTGSGKSTTLCAMIDSINRHREDHIITIEDPIEFTHESQRCLVNQREVHNHTDSFKDALRAALREDPDILLVGEMRDLETISIAIETAETGHLVFGTLHTTTAPSTIDRIIDQFPADRQQQIRVMLSESLKGVIAQTLLPKKGGGRVAALEVLIVTPAISNLIREGKTFQITSAMQTGKNLGMVMLNDALMAHVLNGSVEPMDAYIKAVDKTGFESMLKKNGFKL